MTLERRDEVLLARVERAVKEKNARATAITMGMEAAERR
jgi:hypothetical protein